MKALISYHEATAEDGETFGRFRWEMSQEDHPELAATQHDERAYYAEYARYLREGITGGDMRGWLAEAHGEPVGCALLLIWRMPPVMGRLVRKRGYVGNVYVAPEVRRQGVAREMMRLLIAAARDEGIYRLILWPSEMGQPLYESLGFTPEGAIELDLG